MIQPLLISKLSIPSLYSGHILRPHLMARLHAPEDYKLTLLCAPAGFGKSSVLSEWASQTSMSTAWLSLDISDNDPSRFLQYLVAACQSHFSGLHDSYQFEPLTVNTGSIQLELAAFVHRLTGIAEPLSIILDNYQVIENQVIHDAVASLLNHLPSQAHLYIASRTEPPLHLARFRTRDQMTELRVDDLRFSIADTEVFLRRQSNFDVLSEAQIATLFERTEGWVEGLRAVVISLRNRNRNYWAHDIDNFSGCNQYITDYLTEEVFHPQSQELQTFLMQTSILDRFTNSLCRAVTKHDNVQHLLERIVRDNLFIESVNGVQYSYRYYQLFSDYLRQRLRQLYPNQVPELHRRASRWYEQRNSLGDAIQHALAGHDWDYALRLIDSLSTNASNYRHCYVDSHDSNRRDASAYWIHPDGYLHCVPKIKSQTSPSLEANPENRGLSSLDVYHRYMQMGQVAEAEQILTSIDMTHPDFEDMSAQFAVVSLLGQARMLKGRLGLSSATCAPIMDLAVEEPVRANLFNFYHGLWALHYEWNQLDKANKNLLLFREKNGQHDSPAPWTALSYADLAWQLLATGQKHAAEDTMSHAVELAKRLEETIYLRKIAAQQARFYLLQNNIEVAQRWRGSYRLPSNECLNYAKLDEYLTLARLLIHEGHPNQALSLLEQLHIAAEESQRKRDVIKILTLIAVACHAKNEHEQAFATLAEAVCRAEQEEYIRTFLDEGAPVRELLEQLNSRGVALLYTRKLLMAFGHLELASDTNGSTQSRSALVEPLSLRELEVLRLVADGCRNQEIAKQLTIAASTVKKHVSNILTKLTAKNRTQAVTKAREQGLI